MGAHEADPQSQERDDSGDSSFVDTLKVGGLILLVISVVLIRLPVDRKSGGGNHSFVGGGVADPSFRQDGKELAAQYCGTCHEAPDPGIATRTEWAFELLPAKRVWLGLDTFDFDAHIGGTNLAGTLVFPTKPALSLNDWREICNYYLAVAGLDTGLRKAPQPAPPISELFEVRRTESSKLPQYSFAKIDPALRVVYLGNVVESSLDVMAVDGRRLVSRPFPSEPSAIAVTEDMVYITLFGNRELSDENNGTLLAMSKPGSGGPGISVVDSQLRRPTSLAVRDFTADGSQDLVIGEQGGYLGALTWLEKQDAGYQIRALLKAPGIRAVAVADFNRDSRPDIAALLGFGREGLFVFENSPEHGLTNTFHRSKHARWQFSDLVTADLNGDGLPDIITANGASDRIGKEIKPIADAHGISAWINDGNGGFDERRIHPLAGARKVVAADFSGDGRMDLAAIGYTTEPRHLNSEAFVYLENLGEQNWRPFGILAAGDARWADLDAGDVDGDGDMDIVLVAAHPGADAAPDLHLENWQEKKTGMLMLINRSTETQ